MRMVLVRLAAAARYAGVPRALLLDRMRAARLRLLGVLAVLVAGARTADPVRVGMFLRHLTDPADSPDGSCSARCFLAGPVASRSPAPACAATYRAGSSAHCQYLSGCDSHEGRGAVSRSSQAPSCLEGKPQTPCRVPPPIV